MGSGRSLDNAQLHLDQLLDFALHVNELRCFDIGIALRRNRTTLMRARDGATSWTPARKQPAIITVQDKAI
jgi:hypothetical protein